ncbi:Aste57867_10253 [Aphanomyces stellatus]|uniref:Aste57867_10253 protein n=1 Tax=Aphanomyces stellatus TaxID=120398 RepID=A0A485KQD1_9STRA|nr:hypothetical protein As57867_010214 [Aphanomyces stellatus]VFT87128.1 Aste57867_10253 [Aphanomyces stellatus]
MSKAANDGEQIELKARNVARPEEITSPRAPSSNQHAATDPRSLRLKTGNEPDDIEDAQARVMMRLSPAGKRALGGVLACSIALVNDGSESRVWAQTFYRFLADSCCELPASATEAFLPVVQVGRSRTAASTSSSSQTYLEDAPIDSAPFVAVIESEISRDEVVQMLCFVLWRTTHAVGYDARTRAMLRLVTRQFHDIPWSAIAAEEVELARALLLEAHELQTRKKVASPRKWGDWRRNLAIGGAAVAGGTLLALTGGLALPVLASGFSLLGTAGAAVGGALMTSGGITAATVLFGTAGAGLAGFKADRRTVGIKHFEFELLTPGDGMHVYICVAGWLDDDESGQANHNAEYSKAFGTPREYLRAFYEQYCPEKLDTIEAMLQRYKGREDDLFAALRKQYGLVEGQDPVTVHLEQVLPKETTTTAATAPPPPLSPVRLRAWQWKHRMPHGDQYSLCYERDTLLRYGKCMKSFTTQMLLGYARGELLKHTILATIFAALTLPTMVVNLCNMIDSEWTMAMSRADTCGVLLAKALMERQQGLRPVSLIGYGMGARLIFSCLKHMAAQGDSGVGIVENAVLLGATIPVVPPEWTAVRQVVAGRLVNGFSTNDWMLAIMFRYQNFSLGAAGISPIDAAGVENVDLTTIIQGHMEYPNKIGLILEVLQLES